MDLNMGSLACRDGHGNRAGVGDAPVPPADPDYHMHYHVSLPMPHSDPDTQEQGVFWVLSGGKDEAHSE